MKNILMIVLLACASVVQAAAPEVYEKKWRDPAINARIDANIEKYRKGDAAIALVDAAGKPIADAKVEIVQTGHEFLFGCNAFVLGQLKTPEENQRYEAAFVKLFNFATVPLYWEATEPKQGELRYQEGVSDFWRRPPADRYVPFAQKHGLTLKGHPLLWHAYNPSWLPKDPDALRALYQKRFKEILGRYGEKFAIFDVVNESQVCKNTYPLYTPDRAYVKWAFDQVTPLVPSTCTIMINEVTSYNFRPAEQNPYFAQVKQLLDSGTAVRGIGFQYHYFRREALDKYIAGASCDPVKLLDLYEKFGEFKLPLYVTEITIPSAGEGGDELQAQVIRDIYRLWFAAPNMAGITWWNLGDGTAVKGENEAKGGLMDGDLKPKPAYTALDQLINKEWKTTASAQSDVAGAVRFRGFFGKYKVSVTRNGVTRSFDLAHSRSGETSHRLTWKD